MRKPKARVQVLQRSWRILQPSLANPPDKALQYVEEGNAPPSPREMEIWGGRWRPTKGDGWIVCAGLGPQVLKGQKEKKRERERERKGQPGWGSLCQNMCGPRSLNTVGKLRENCYSFFG